MVSPDHIIFPEVIRERFRNPQRARVRLEAAERAAVMVRDERAWSAANLHTLLQHLQTDWYNGKVVRNRFSPGLVGQHEHWLVESLDAVGSWLSRVRDAFEIELPLYALFETPTIAGLADRLEEELIREADAAALGEDLSELDEMSDVEIRALLASEAEALTSSREERFS